MNKTEKQLDTLYSVLYDLVKQDLEVKFDGYIPYRISVSDEVENTLAKYLESLLDNEKVKNQLVKQTSKAILQNEKDRERSKKEQHKKNLKLWNLSKGKIPCLNQCGTIWTKTKEEVLEGHNNTICKSCCDKGVDTSEVFRKNNIYQIFNIE